MALPDASGSRREIPEGYVAVPISVEQKAAPLRICVLARRQPDPVGGHLVVLRDLIDGQVFLGCVFDAGGVPQRWVELWVQNLDALPNTVAAYREALSNRVLDARWARHFRALEEMDADSLVRTGWETEHPPPVVLRLETCEPLCPVDGVTGAPWVLCQDDALLARKGLLPYSTSLHRYLYLPNLGDESPFVPVTQDAPTGPDTQAPAVAMRDYQDCVPLNLGGGLMLVRRLDPVGYEAFVDLLSGGSWEGVLHGRTPLPAGVGPRELNQADPALPLGGRLFLGQHGRWGRLVETFHLKLRLLADALASVRTLVTHLQRPLLNLSAESLRVEMGRPGCGLPYLWTARAVLADPGDAVALPIAGTDTRYYLRVGAAGASVYRPASAGDPVRGHGTARIRQVVLGTREQTVVEGTFDVQERVSAGQQDLLWLRLNLGERRMDLYGYIDPASALATGEIRFRTVGQRLGEADAAALKAAEGVPLRNTPFEVLPLLSTPCDLYSLGVLAVRTLLVNPRTTLPVALDELLSLARQVAVDHDGSLALGERIRRLFDADKRWVLSLGPQRLTFDEVAPEDAFDLVPADLWWDTLAVIVRMFPGIGPDSACRDFGDAPVGGLHKIFDRALADLEALLLRTRSLIVIDWRFNREIHAVLRAHLGGGRPAEGEGT
ncbi:MAG TPA: hypothetical protein VNE39_04290 [Planctomycetota bacterium]|nr:hypothetical protein [Planctomycetota bacterium]